MRSVEIRAEINGQKPLRLAICLMHTDVYSYFPSVLHALLAAIYIIDIYDMGITGYYYPAS